MKKTIITIVAAAVFMTGCTGAQTAAEPKTVTETKTVTKTETVEVTPQACVEALDLAESLVQGPVVRMTDRQIQLVELVGMAFDAGLANDVAGTQAVVDGLDKVTRETKADSKEVENMVSAYNEASSECREAGGNNA